MLRGPEIGGAASYGGLGHDLTACVKSALAGAVVLKLSFFMTNAFACMLLVGLVRNMVQIVGCDVRYQDHIDNW
jgi:hypothetical protein